ncbi:MAG: SufS family cysteine desulfurase [Enterobacteriaceae bacterium]|nr:SufS family cysteine desulfurase [Enterobacteriaceae bacterium]
MNNDFFLNLRKEFPIFNKLVNNNKLSYLDNAALTQVPNCVINSIVSYYSSMNANVHRGVYYLSELATEHYELEIYKIKNYINANDYRECIFVRGTTEGINLVANSYVRKLLKKGDEILISAMEHHSNIVPWYLLCEEFSAVLKIIPILENGDLDYSVLESLFSCKTKIVSLTHISNAIGTVNNIKKIISFSHSKGIPVLIDGAQSLAHMRVDVKDLDCDFFTISSHKMYGPNGIGVLYGKKSILDSMIPYQGGGDMIKHVSYSKILWNDLPYKFEAGTPSIANAIAFGSAIDFLNNLDLEFVFDYKRRLFEYAYNRLSEIPGLKIIGNPENKSAIISFIVDGIHSHDLGTIANHYGVSIRTGHHCSIPLMNFYGVSATTRISLGIYNVSDEIDALVNSILRAKEIFR